MAKLKSQLEAEIVELTEALKESDSDFKRAEEKAEKFEARVKVLEAEVADLEYEKEQQPVFKLLVDEIKYELFLEHYTKFTLEQFETFIKIGDMY